MLKPTIRAARLAAPLLALVLGACDPADLSFGNLIFPLYDTTRPPADIASLRSRFDGSYQGRTVLVKGDPDACLRPHYGVAEIGDAVLTYAYTPDTILTAAVDADGRMRTEQDGTVLTGQITGSKLLLDITNGPCETHARLAYVWNRS